MVGYDHFEDELDQSLLLTAEPSVPAATAKPLLSVVAPATLPEGYTMDGGVEEGQTFEVTISEETTAGSTVEEDGLHGAVALRYRLDDARLKMRIMVDTRLMC
jgi:hypothetical protein